MTQGIPDHTHQPSRQLAVAHSKSLDPRLDRVIVQITDGPYTFAVAFTTDEAHALAEGLSFNVKELRTVRDAAAKALRG